METPLVMCLNFCYILYNYYEFLPDYEPNVNMSLSTSDILIYINIAAMNDTVFLEDDNITLTFTSVFDNFAKRVQMGGEFVRESATVVIIDNDGEF